MNPNNLLKKELITSSNQDLIDVFLGNAGNSLKTFRYFNKRDKSVLKNHLITLLYFVDNLPICYGHLDHDVSNGRIWLGVAVIEAFLGKGYGKLMLNDLIEFAKTKQVEKIYLSVDRENIKASRLYQKFSF